MLFWSSGKKLLTTDARLPSHFFTITENTAQWNKKVKERLKVHWNLFLKKVVQGILLM